MAETQSEVVKELVGEAAVDPTSTETNQASTASEGVNTPTAEEVERTRSLYDNAIKARDEERRMRKEAEEAKRTLEERLNATSYSGENDNDDEGVTRFLKVEALTKLNAMATYDPIVKDNFKAIQEEIEKNPNMGIESATDKVLAETMRHILKSSDVVSKERPPQGLSTQAMPEEQPQSTESEEDAAVRKQLDEKLSNIR